jgi:hypothetical protein
VCSTRLLTSTSAITGSGTLALSLYAVAYRTYTATTLLSLTATTAATAAAISILLLLMSSEGRQSTGGHREFVRSNGL